MNSPRPNAARFRYLWIVIAAVSALAISSNSSFAAIEVDFDQEEYIVSGPGDPIALKIHIDADHATPELEAVANGLFSFGAALEFDATKAQVSSIEVVDPVDFFGYSAGGFTQIDPGFGGGKGNIDQSSPALAPYEGDLLLEVTLTNLASPVDAYPLSLDFFRTLGENEQIFLDGTGTVLDPQIQFGRAIVRVVPEPSASSVLAIALATCFIVLRRLA